MNCPKCSAENPDGVKFCNKCGTSLAVPVPESAPVPPPISECPSCKAPKKDDAKFCGNCGQRFDEVAAVAPDTTAPVAAAIVTPDASKLAAPVAEAAPKGNNTVIIIIIVALLAIIIAAGAGWYMFKGKSASTQPTAASVSGQPGMPQVDGNGMPVKQPSADGRPSQPGMPQVDANGMPITQPGQQQTPAQPGADGQQPVQQPATLPDRGGAQPQAAQPAQDVMPDQMPQEARKRKARSEADVAPRRNVRVGGSIDEQFKQRGAAECPAGGSGFFCREKIRYQLCNGRWAANPPAGQTMCQKVN